MIIGVSLVLAACFIWGLIFVIPQFLIGFSPIEVALGRYFVFGTISLIIMLISGFKKWRHLSLSIWKKAMVYALIVNIVYYLFLVLGLRYSNPSVIALIIGISPISIAFYGNWRNRECDFKQLILPSCLIAIGIVLVNLEAIQMHENMIILHEYVFGLCCGFLSLIAWNWFVVSNAEFLKENPTLPPGDWATLIGVGTLLWVAVIGSLVWISRSIEPLNQHLELNQELKWFLIGSLTLGFICSWVGSYLWNSASKFLPVSFAGHLTIFETLFGLMFIYLYESRYPTKMELIGIMTLLSGVIMSIYIFKRVSTRLIYNNLTSN